MPATSFVDASHRVVVTICSGQLTLDEVKTTFADTRRHPDFHPDFRQLINLSKVSKCLLYSKDLYQLRQEHDPFSNKGKRAVVAPHGVLFGIGRMYQQILNSQEFEVFDSLVEARTWLGLNAVMLDAALQSASSALGLKEETSLLDVPSDDPSGDTTPKHLRKGSSG
ncbi:MAG TPA: hypothetical protein VNY29_09055 [Terriglobales bacterium]|jgi:hypothetical protein|nr:hypothetical protein [Terriglobales bacterium]